MAENERITNPSMGSNQLGEETTENDSTGISAGSDTQLELTAAGGKKHHKKHETAEEYLRKEKNKAEFLAKNKVEK